MPSRTLLPRSSILFLAVAVVVVLQWIPVTGIFLMLMLAPLWTGPLLVLALLALTFEAARGLTHRAWLVIPLVCALVFGVGAWRSRAEAEALIAAWAHVNDGANLPFDPTRRDLVLERSTEGASAGSLLTEYDLPVVYETETTRTDRRSSLHRLASGPICDTTRRDPSLSAAGVHAWGIHERRDERNRFVSDVCHIEMPGAPVRPTVTVSVERRRAPRDDAANRWSATVTLRSDERTVVRHLGGISPLPWFPYPIIGCYLNSGAPSWNCSASFQRAREIRLGDVSVEAAIVAALGLAPAPASTRHAAIAALPPPDFAPVVADREATSLAALDAVLADPTRRATVHDLQGLAAHPAVWADRDRAMVAAIGLRLARPRPDKETQRNLAILLAALPADRLVPLLPDLIAIWGKVPAPGLDVDVVSGTMVKRLPDLGETALPILERLAFDTPRTSVAEPIRALCRLGPLAARDADAIARRLETTERRRDDYDAAVLALLRLGRRDLAEPIVRRDIAEEQRRREEKRAGSTMLQIAEHLPAIVGGVTVRRLVTSKSAFAKYEGWLAEIDAASPPEVCDRH